MPKCAVWNSETLEGDGPVTGQVTDGTTIAVDRRTLSASVTFEYGRVFEKNKYTFVMRVEPHLRHLIPRDDGHEPLPLRKPLNLVGRLDLVGRLAYDVVAEIRLLVRDRPAQVLDYAACVLRNRPLVCGTLCTFTGEDDSDWGEGEEAAEKAADGEKQPTHTPAERALAYTEWVHWIACTAIHRARVASTRTRLSDFLPID